MLGYKLEDIVTQSSNANKQENDTFEECGSESLFKWNESTQADVGGVSGAGSRGGGIEDSEGSWVGFISSALAGNSGAWLVNPGEC